MAKKKRKVLNEPLLQAVKVAGSQTKLATAINTKQQNIWCWLYETGVVPAEKVLLIEKYTGVSRFKLRPDVYPKEAA